MKIPHTLSEFEQTYYYKGELVKLCKRLRLPTSGTKAELNSYIKKYLSGIDPIQIKTIRSNKRHRSLTYNEISIDTKLVTLVSVLTMLLASGLQIILVSKSSLLVRKWPLLKEKLS